MADAKLPILYVEGMDDVSVISGLLRRHGFDTNRGFAHLNIKALLDIDSVMTSIPSAIKASTDRPVGFVVDIDVQITDRWQWVASKLREAGDNPPDTCPHGGYICRLPDYRFSFGVWLMPDCQSDLQKLEHLAESLIPPADALWPYAKQCAAEAARINQRFIDPDLIKAEIHTWLAWQKEPGANLGAAVNCHILGCDSPQAISLLAWLKSLYELSN